MYSLESLQKEEVFRYFMELTTIPRPSKHEQKVRAWVIAYAQKWDRTYKEDSYGNIVVFVPPTDSMENLPSVVIQSHLDMVCEKNSDRKIDFLTDPLELTLEEVKADGTDGKAVDGSADSTDGISTGGSAGEIADGTAAGPVGNPTDNSVNSQLQWLTAKGTTLGADNGIAVAMAMELMDPKLDIEHGPLELLFTLDEETGLNGAANLAADMICSSYLINIDNSEEGFFCTGCAGGRDFISSIPVATSIANDTYLSCSINIQGLSGGHSGMEIFDGRANAIKILEWLLSDLQEEIQISVSSLDGGNKRNAIPHFASAQCWIAKSDLNALQKYLDTFQQNIALELTKIDQDFHVELLMKDRQDYGQENREVFSKTSLKRILSFIQLCPHGVLYRNGLDSLETTLSNNLASIRTEQARVIIVNNCRFLSPLADRYISRIINNLFADDDISNYTENYYVEWKPKAQSKLLAFCKKEYENIFLKKAVIGTVHAGIECAVLNTRVPQNLDMISFGPNIDFLHSPKERVHIASTVRVWDFLKKILAKFSDLKALKS